MTIAVDFDGTIVEHEYPKIGKPIPFAFDVLRKLQQEEHYILILWTIREGRLLQEAIDFCEQNGVHFYACNKNYPEEEDSDGNPRKIGVDIFIDDRNIGGMLDWGTIYKILKSGFNSLKHIDLNSNTIQSRIKKNWMIRFGEAWEKAKNKKY